MRSERRAIVEISTQIPCAIPGILLERRSQRGSLRAPCGGDLGMFGARQWNPAFKNAQQELGEPYAFPSTFDSYAIHSIVPIAGTHQGHTLRPNAE